MDRKLRKILTECIRDIETGARDVEGCLQRHPDRAAELRPHLELWRSLNAAPMAQPNLGSQQRGQHQLLAALSEMEREREKRIIPFLTPALAKAAAVVAGVALLAGGAAGASAALGGPDVAGEVLSGIGISNASDTGKKNANPNAWQGSENAGEGIDNASQIGRDHANLDPPAGPDNSGQDISNASPTGRGNANPNARDGAGNADDGKANANDAAQNAPGTAAGNANAANGGNAGDDGDDPADEHEDDE